MEYSVTEDIISKICSMTKEQVLDMKKELNVAEPILYKWAKDSIKDEIKELKYSGVQMLNDDSVKYVGSMLLQAKIEGFLIGLMSCEKEWNNLFLLSDNNSKIPYMKPVNALLEGHLQKKYYDELYLSMTTDELNDKNHWKHKAIEAYKEYTIKQASLKNASAFLDDSNKKSDGSNDNRTPDVTITP